MDCHYHYKVLCSQVCRFPLFERERHNSHPHLTLLKWKNKAECKRSRAVAVRCDVFLRSFVRSCRVMMWICRFSLWVESNLISLFSPDITHSSLLLWWKSRSLYIHLRFLLPEIIQSGRCEDEMAGHMYDIGMLYCVTRKRLDQGRRKKKNTEVNDITVFVLFF